MHLRFTKMEGLGNDYVYVDCLEKRLENPEMLARLVSDRHRGIGGDGLILIEPSDKADFAMSIYNADGSRAEMCGNGIRCVGKYVYDHGLTQSREISVETAAGVRRLVCEVADGRVRSVTVDMGSPVVMAETVMLTAVPAATVGEPAEPLTCSGEPGCCMTCVSMGNPHAVVFVDDVESYPVAVTGAAIERHPRFPGGTNVEFVRVDDEDHMTMRVWERGSGETQACGTGACAAVFAAILKGRVSDDVCVRLPGGELDIRYDRGQNKIYMTGPAKVVFDGYTDII